MTFTSAPLPGFETDAWILSQQPPKNPVDPGQPYAYLVEPERTAGGVIEDVATLFLTNLPAISECLALLDTVIVECHPLLVDSRCLAFRESLRPALQVALGLETVHPEVLPRLNKRLTLADFERAVRLLREHAIAVRAVILLRPPYLDEAEGVHWAMRSLEYAFAVGVECCVVIPTRAGNGAMERLQEQGLFSPPRLDSLEEAIEYGIGLRAGRVFADLWGVEKFPACPRCGPERIRRLQAMNLTQTLPPPVRCECRLT